MKPMRGALRSLSCALLVLASSDALAAQTMDRTGGGATMQGKVRSIAREQYILLGAHNALQKQVSETLHKLNGIVLSNPAFSPPMGLDVAPSLLARTGHVGVNRGFIWYEVGELFYWYRMVKDGKIVPEIVHCCGFTLWVNYIEPVFDKANEWVEDPDKLMYWAPRQTGEEAGHPYYDTHVVVVKKIDRPIWIPVTKEEAIKRRLANAKKALAELPPEAMANVHKEAKEEVACLEAGLGALPASERGQPAYMSHAPTVNQPGGCTGLVDAKTPYARGLVRENPNFYDRSAPPHLPQLLVLNFRYIQYPPHIWHSKVVDKLRDEMDYAALTAMLVGK